MNYTNGNVLRVTGKGWNGHTTGGAPIGLSGGATAEVVEAGSRQVRMRLLTGAWPQSGHLNGQTQFYINYNDPSWTQN